MNVTLHGVVSYWNSTSNHNWKSFIVSNLVVVSYWNSTSNHNLAFCNTLVCFVVSYWNSTSNHNLLQEFVNCWRLYLIEILHQTTTSRLKPNKRKMLYLIEILHQTTTYPPYLSRHECCILLKFYIKPQQDNFFVNMSYCCILLKFYIKPQLSALAGYETSKLYLIEILHQTTTSLRTRTRLLRCILLKFYIKPQLRDDQGQIKPCCILLKFYIKPQRRASYWLIKCYFRAVCHYKNTIGCSDEASLMHFPYFKERK